MIRILSLTVAACACLVLTSCTVPPGQVKRHAAPGQVKHYTGCNYRSGKCKLPKPNLIAKAPKFGIIPNVDVWDLYD